jgi:acetyl-CoA carboxylase biotin carboxyl carrier protein
VVTSREAHESGEASAMPADGSAMPAADGSVKPAAGESRAVGPGRATRATTTPGSNDDGHRLIAQLTAEMLPTLIARLGESNLGEIEVREDGWRVRLRRPQPANGAVPPSDEPRPARRAEPGATPRTARAGGAASPTDAGTRPADAADGGRGLVTSPAVGYFLLREGMAARELVRQGDLIGHIDVLGVRQEVVAGHDGVVRRLEVESGQAVEYGQPIARIEPEKPERRG